MTVVMGMHHAPVAPGGCISTITQSLQCCLQSLCGCTLPTSSPAESPRSLLYMLVSCPTAPVLQPAQTAACRLRVRKAPLTCLQIDPAFEDCEAIQALPRLVYALLRSPLLSICPGQHPDARASLQQLWTCLQPLELRRAVYPLLSSYMDPDTEAGIAWAGTCTLLTQMLPPPI